MANKVALPAIIDGISTLKDGSIKVVLQTRELPPKEMAILFGLRNLEAWAVLSPVDDISVQDIPVQKPDAGMGGKSPSQRLRAVLFVLWEQRGKNGDFEAYYNTYMERFINTIKDNLDG